MFLFTYDHLFYVPKMNFKEFYLFSLYRNTYELSAKYDKYDENVIVDMFDVIFNRCDLLNMNDYTFSFTIDVARLKGTTKSKFIKYDESNLIAIAAIKYPPLTFDDLYDSFGDDNISTFDALSNFFSNHVRYIFRIYNQHISKQTTLSIYPKKYVDVRKTLTDNKCKIHKVIIHKTLNYF